MKLKTFGKLRNVARSFFLFRFRGYKQIAGLLFLGTLLRIAVSPYTSHPNDEEVWYIAAVNMLSGQGNPYGTWYFAYPPVWAYIYLPFVTLGSLFSNPYLFYVRINLDGVVPIMCPLFNFVVKLPIIIGDIFVGLIIYRLISNLKDEQVAREAFIFWFFNPFVIFTGAMIAQFDVLPALASLLAFVFFIQRKYLLVGVSLGVAIMAKIYPVYFIPFYITLLFKPNASKEIEWKKGFFRSTVLFTGIFLTVFILLIPILSFNSFPIFLEGILRRGEYVTSIGGLTFMNLLYVFGDAMQWINDYGRLQIIYAILSVLQMIGIALVSFHFAFRSNQKQHLKSLLSGHVCIVTIVLLTTLTVNPQYFVWTMPFLILCYGLYGDYRIRISLLSVSALFLAFLWAYPFYPVIVYVNEEIGMTLNNVLNLSTNPLSFPLMIFFGLLSATTILLLPFSKLKISKLRILLTRLRSGEKS